MMIEAKDILLDADNHFLIKDGDFVVGPSTEQHIKHIIMAEKGWWKFSPLVGFGVLHRLNAPLTLEVRLAAIHDLSVQLAMDGLKVNTLEIASWDNIKVDATY